MEGSETLYHGGHDDLSIFEGMVGFEDFNPMDDSALTTIFDDLQEGTLLSILNDELFDDLVASPKGTCAAQQLGENGEQSSTYSSSSDSCEEEHPTTASPVETSGQTTRSLCSTRSIGMMNDVNCEVSPPSHNMQCSKESLQMADPTLLVKQATMSIDPTTRKRARHDSYENHSNCKEQKLSPVIDLQHLLECVQHDHCYTAAKEKNVIDDRRGSVMSERSTRSSSSDSLEEGSNSDGGKG